MTSTLNTGAPARDIGNGIVAAISRTVSFDTPRIGTADIVKVGALPAGSQALQCIVRVVTPFNAATTNVLTVGTSSGSNADFVGTNDVDESTAGTAVVVTCAGLAFSADTSIYAKYTQSGTAATAGSAVITIIYVNTIGG